MMSYYDTFIQVAPDCPVRTAVVPTSKRAAKTIPQIEYELLVGSPYTLTQEEFLFAVHVQRSGLSKRDLEMCRADLWREFFSKSRACLRASQLPKKFGWGLHFDSEGRIALVAMESEAYRAFAEGQGVSTVLTAMRNKKA